MTRAEVKTLAETNGIDDVTRAWFEEPKEGYVVIKPDELDFVDIWFENDRAVRFQRGNYVSFTTGVEIQEKADLCTK